VDGITDFQLGAQGSAFDEPDIHSYLRAYADALYELAVREHPEVIHTRGDHLDALVGSAVARAIGIRSVCEVGDLSVVARGSRRSMREGDQHLEVRAAFSADVVVCASDTIKDQIVRWGVPPDKIRVVPDGLGPDTRVPQKLDVGLKASLGLGDGKVIGYFGDIEHCLGLDLLLHAIAVLRTGKADDFAVLFAGDGSALEELRRLADELLLGDVITFESRVPAPEVDDWYSMVDVVVLPRSPATDAESGGSSAFPRTISLSKYVAACDATAGTDVTKDLVNGILDSGEGVGALAASLVSVLRPTLDDRPPPRQSVLGRRSVADSLVALDSIYKSVTSPLEPAPQVTLDQVQLSGEMERIFEEYRKKYEVVSPAHLRRDDYARWSYVSRLLKHETSLLDVGIGVGQFVNALASRGTFERIVGVDVQRHSLFITLHDGFETEYVSIESLPYEDGEFDVVTCMETIEHLPDAIFSAGVEQLRRVCKRQLIVTVPFREEVLGTGHMRRFDFDDIERLFPASAVTLFRKETRVRGRNAFWALVEETFA